MGLQDQNLNSNCALPSRKSSYKAECGDDFQEINFKSFFWISGYDQRLQKRCETGKPKEELFKTTKNYCYFLKDENLHQNCFWDDRKDKFKSLNCEGSFSQEPEHVSSPAQKPPAPNNPTYPSNPQNPPNNNSDIPIVNELKTYGIDVKIHWGSIRQMGANPLPGEPTVNEKMKIFWSELELNKYEIIKRKSMIKELNVTIFTRYQMDTSYLYLDFESKRGVLSQYFGLLDQIVNLSQELRIDFSFIHNASDEGSITYLPLRQFIQVLEKNRTKIKNMPGMINSVETNSYSNYYFYRSTLIINRDKIVTDFEKYLDMLETISPIFVWSKSHNLELSVESSFELEKEFNDKKSLFLTLGQLIPSLEAIYNANMLKALDINFGSSLQHYWSSLQKLSINIDNSNKEAVKNSIKALERQAKMSTALGIPVEYNSYDIDEDYLAALAKFEFFFPKIKSKQKMLKKIRLSSYSRYSSYSQELTIGKLSSDAETLKEIESIK